MTTPEYMAPERVVERAIENMVGDDSASVRAIAEKCLRALHEGGFAVLWVRHATESQMTTTERVMP